MVENGVAIPSDENDAPTLVSDASNSSTFGIPQPLDNKDMQRINNEDYMSSDEEIVIDEQENEQKLEIEKIEEKKHEINNILDENEIVLEPKNSQVAQEIEVDAGEIGLPTLSTPQEDHEMGTQERRNV
nr:hypothetical protein CFP56_62231 [Quercus suber]